LKLKAEKPNELKGLVECDSPGPEKGNWDLTHGTT